jgi:oligopeptide transport system permease protein
MSESSIEAAVAEQAPVGVPAGGGKPRSLTADAWNDLKRSKIFWLSAVLVVLILVMAAWPSLFTSADPRSCSLSRQHLGPTGHAYFGYDFQGCDVFAKTVYGARASIIVGVGATLLAGLIGLFFGLAAGFYGGWIDALLSRFIDVMLGVPFLLGAIVLARRLSADPQDNGIVAVTVTLGVLGWTTAARVMRASVISSKNQDYVAAARMLGAGTARLMLRHILPNSIASFIVVLTILLGINIASEATLSFLGVGLKGAAWSGWRPRRWSGRRCSWPPRFWPSSCSATRSAMPSTLSCGDQ